MKRQDELLVEQSISITSLLFSPPDTRKRAQLGSMLASHQDLSSRAIRDFQRPLGGLKRRLLWLVSSVPEAFCPYCLPLKHSFMTFSRDAGRSPVLQESGQRVPLSGQFISSDTPQGSRNHLSPRAGSSFWFGFVRQTRQLALRSCDMRPLRLGCGWVASWASGGAAGIHS